MWNNDTITTSSSIATTTPLLDDKEMGASLLSSSSFPEAAESNNNNAGSAFHINNNNNNNNNYYSSITDNSSSSRSNFDFEEEIESIICGLVGGGKYGMKIRFPHAFVMTFLFRNDLSISQKCKAVLRLSLEHSMNLAAFATIYKTTLALLKWTSIRLLQQEQQDQKSSSSLWNSLGRIFLSMIVNGTVPSLVTAPLRTTKPPPSAPPVAKPGFPQHYYHSFLAGTIGGYWVWGRYSSVNYQILLYLSSRIAIGLVKRFYIQLFLSSSLHDNKSNNNNNQQTTAAGTTNKASLLLSKKSLFNNKHTYPVVAATIWGIVMILFEECPEVLHPSLKKSMIEIYRYKNNNQK